MKPPELAELEGAFVLRPTGRPATKADYTAVVERAGEVFKPSQFTVLARLPAGDEPPAGISMIWPALRTGLKGVGRSYWRDPRDGEPAENDWQERGLLDFKAHKAQAEREREREPTYGVKEIEVHALVDGDHAWKPRLEAQADHLKMRLTDGRIIFLAQNDLWGGGSVETWVRGMARHAAGKTAYGAAGHIWYQWISHIVVPPTKLLNPKHRLGIHFGLRSQPLTWMRVIVTFKASNECRAAADILQRAARFRADHLPDLTTAQRRAHLELIDAPPFDNHKGKTDRRDLPGPHLGVSAWSAGIGLDLAGEVP